MMRLVRRVARMDSAEIRWRLAAAARTAAQRARHSIRPPGWDRADLAARLSPTLGVVRDSLERGHWVEAHEELTRQVLDRPTRFVIRAGDRFATAARINSAFPNAAADAAAHADRLLAGSYDLLGYSGLSFRRGALDIDWHFDPVHDRRPPMAFFASVPYLDPLCGDHKIIWELNRQQHWLALGRAWWLTGDRRYRARVLAELTSWLDANPPLTGINWASMLELGFRSISWLWALHFFADRSVEDETPWTVDLLLALDRQLTLVEQNLSRYFSPNTHLLGEALALYVAGRAIPELAASDRRAAAGRAILVHEAARQIAADGGHGERSTHYHRYTLDFYLLALAVARITRDPIAAAFERTVAKLAAAARVLADDTGRVPHLGDDDGGMLCPIARREADDWRDCLGMAAALTGDPSLRIDEQTEEELWLQARRRPPSRGSERRVSAALPDTGYYVSRISPGAHVVIDGGPHGYQNAGHAHADALSMTLSLGGCPLLIDPGTACYTINGALRDRFRSTAAHNTLALDGRPQSDPDGPFHWSRMADATTHRWRTTDGFDFFDGSHDGYEPARHRRRVFVAPDLIVVADHVDADGEHQAAVHWHVDPRWAVEVRHRAAHFRSGNRYASLIVPEGEIDAFEADEASGLGWHSPAYGRVEPATTLRLTHAAAGPFWMVSVFDLAGDDPIRRVDWTPLWAEAGVMAHAAALTIDRAGWTDRLLFAEPLAGDARATWRMAEFETDSRMLFWRTRSDGALARIGLVDGSLVRCAGRRSFNLALGRTRPALFINETSIRTFTPCAASPAS